MNITNTKFVTFLPLLMILIFSDRKLIIGQNHFEKIFADFEQEPIILFSPEELTFIDYSSDEEFLLLIKNEANKILIEDPAPLNKIYYEGLVSNDPNRIKTVNHLNDMVKIRTLLWAYLLTNDSKYLIKSKEYILLWCIAYLPNGNDVNEGKLIPIVEAYYYLSCYFENSEKIIIENIIKCIADEQIAKAEINRKSGNRAAKRVMIVLLGGIVLQNENYIKWSVEKYYTILETSIYRDGRSWDLLRRDALHYHVAGIVNMLEVVQLAKMLNYILYPLENAVGGSLKKSIEFLIPYVNKELEHPEWVNTTIELDKLRWKAGDYFYKPGKIWDPKESRELFLLSSLSDSSMITISEKLSDEMDRKSLYYFQIKQKQKINKLDKK